MKKFLTEALSLLLTVTVCINTLDLNVYAVEGSAAEETVVVGDEVISVEEEQSLVETVVIEETGSVEEEKSDEEIGTVGEKSTEETATVEEVVSTVETTTVEELTEETTMVEEVVSTVEATTVEESTEETTTVEEVESAEEGTTVEEVESAEEGTTVEEVESAEEGTTVEEAESAEEATTVEEEPSTEETTSEEIQNGWDGITTQNIYETEDFKITFNLDSYWSGAFNATIKIENIGNEVIQDWYLSCDCNYDITNIWNALIQEKHEKGYIIKNASWNQDIPIGGVVEFGFSANGDFAGFPENYELLGEKAQVSEEDYSIEYSLDSDWGSGFTGRISITNNTDATFEDWVLVFDFDRKITSIWNGVIESQEENHYVVMNAGYNSNIAPNQTISFGFCGQEGSAENEPYNTQLFTYDLYSQKYESHTVTFDFNYDGIIEVQNIENGICAVRPDTSKREEYFFMGWYIDKELTEYFDIDNTPITKDITLYADWLCYTDETDTDNDGITDVFEERLGTDKTKADTDEDGLSDYWEIIIVETDPLKVDSDGDSILDGNEDKDADGLTNLDELSMGTKPEKNDSDADGLSDGEEVYCYGTNPLLKDTDGDGVSDGKEIEIQTNPLVAEESFDIIEYADEGEVNASVEITLSGEQVESLSVEKVINETLFPETIPGYIGEAYDFNVEGDFDTAIISFEFDASLLEKDGFAPVIYYFNEEEQQLEALETIVAGNVASASIEHFSKYILIDSSVYEASFKWIDVWDSNDYTGVELVLVIDDSGSMYSNDRYNQRLVVSQNLVNNLPENSKVGIVRFASSVSALTTIMLDDKEVVNSYLSTSYFHSSGGTMMYSGIQRAFSLFSTDESNVMRMMVVLSDGSTSDTYMHSSMISTAIDKGIKIYTVGLGGYIYYFNNFLNPLAINTGGAFYLSSNANELANIYKDISQKIDIETDSDGDGIADYYEDNMIIFNGVQISMDKNSPDTDGDGLSDGEEVILNYEYNEDKTKVRVTGKLLSNPSMVDSDGDLDNDSIDPEPLDFQLNDLLCDKIERLCDIANEYKEINRLSSSGFDTTVEVWLTFMFIRQFNSSYVSSNWDGTGKSIDYDFVNYVKEKDSELYLYFANKSDFYATKSGEKGDLYHMAATATGYIYNSNYSNGLKFGLMPEYHLNSLSGWAGDLQTAMNNAMDITEKSEDYEVFKKTMRNLIGYDENVDDMYAEYSHTFDIDDVYGDTDAYNLYKLLKDKVTMEKALSKYFKTEYVKRFSIFTDYKSEDAIKDDIYVYTKNKYMGLIRWPLFQYDFKTSQSKAARDAFCEYLMERIQNE